MRSYICHAQMSVLRQSVWQCCIRCSITCHIQLVIKVLVNALRCAQAMSSAAKDGHTACHRVVELPPPGWRVEWQVRLHSQDDETATWYSYSSV